MKSKISKSVNSEYCVLEFFVSMTSSVYKNPDKICQDFFLEIVRIFLEKLHFRKNPDNYLLRKSWQVLLYLKTMMCCSDTTTTYNCSFNVSHTSSGLLISKVIDSWFIPNRWAGKILIRKWVNPGIYSSFVCSPDGGPATWVPPLEGQDGRHIVLIFMVYGIWSALCFGVPWPKLQFTIQTDR